MEVYDTKGNKPKACSLTYSISILGSDWLTAEQFGYDVVYLAPLGLPLQLRHELGHHLALVCRPLRSNFRNNLTRSSDYFIA